MTLRGRLIVDHHDLPHRQLGPDRCQRRGPLHHYHFEMIVRKGSRSSIQVYLHSRVGMTTFSSTCTTIRVSSR